MDCLPANYVIEQHVLSLHADTVGVNLLELLQASLESVQIDHVVQTVRLYVASKSNPVI